MTPDVLPHAHDNVRTRYFDKERRTSTSGYGQRDTVLLLLFKAGWYRKQWMGDMDHSLKLHDLRSMNKLTCYCRVYGQRPTKPLYDTTARSFNLLVRSQWLRTERVHYPGGRDGSGLLPPNQTSHECNIAQWCPLAPELPYTSQKCAPLYRMRRLMISAPRECSCRAHQSDVCNRSLATCVVAFHHVREARSRAVSLKVIVTSFITISMPQ
jgi:hypothetical protein